MGYLSLREELKAYYWEKADESARNFYTRAMAEMDARYQEGMSVFEMKTLQYRTITELFEPILFKDFPFYYETGTLAAHSDGARAFRGHLSAGGWTFWKNQHLYKEQDEELWELRCKQGDGQFYLMCGDYNDDSQHFNFNHRPILEKGLKGIYEDAKSRIKSINTQKENAFLSAVCDAMLCLKRMSEKFAEKAETLLQTETDQTQRENLARIARTAKRTPWEKPESFYEALNMYGFMRVAIGALEGVGPNTFGRIDLDLWKFYENDIREGVLTKDEAYDLICRFLLGWDMRYDHDMKMVKYSDHELENTYVLGGCDIHGEPVYNDLTEMFLRATREEKVIFPKIVCRYGANSPKAYLDEINKAVIGGTSTILYQNDDASIPAFLHDGKTLEEAREYLVTGCWGVAINGAEKYDHGGYVNMLKPFEYSLYNLVDKMQEVGMYFTPIDGAKSFEEVYQITLKNIEVLFKERIRVFAKGGPCWERVDCLPLFSSTIENCLQTKKDITARGGKYNDDYFLLFGFPNIVDSLMAIKTLCFDSGKYTLGEFLDIVRNNWENNETVRIEAMRCHGWGDGNEDTLALAKRFNDDLYALASGLKGTYGGKVHIGYLTYTEVRWWGENLLAMPDGRKNGDYIAQGLTPSRLNKIPNVTDVIHSMSALDGKKIGANSVLNIILPADKITLDGCEAFLRALAQSSAMSLQLNCLTREQLLDAQRHPEKYPDLIVRVTGFSARFTALSPEWQEEVLTRNFYE